MIIVMVYSGSTRLDSILEISSLYLVTVAFVFSIVNQA